MYNFLPPFLQIFIFNSIVASSLDKSQPDLYVAYLLVTSLAYYLVLVPS